MTTMECQVRAALGSVETLPAQIAGPPLCEITRWLVWQPHLRKVLWIDDDPLMHDVEALALRGFAVNCLEATNKVEATIASANPDLVILEAALHSLDAMVLLRTLRAGSPQLPIIIYSKTANYRDDFTSWLADDYILKSEGLTPLCAAIDRLLPSLRARGQHEGASASG